MRGKRQKAYRKLLHQYAVHFGFREPYQVLLDSAILQESHRTKIDIVNRLQGVLGGQVKPMVSQCDMRHLYTATPKSEDLITQAKTYERKRCGHHELDEPLSSMDCIKSCVDPKGSGKNKHNYVVATQDPKLRQALRKIPGVPLIYINKSVMILEPMAEATEELRNQTEKAKFKEGLKGRRNPGKLDAGAGEKRKRDDEEEEGAEAEGNVVAGGDARVKKQKRGPKGPKGPNPLAVRKSKKAGEGEPAKPKAPKSPKKTENPDQPTEAAAEAHEGEGEGAKRKRKRKHKPKGDGGEGAAEGDGGVAVETMDTS